MPPKRARSASVASATGSAAAPAPGVRRSSRASIAPAPVTAPRNPAPARRSRRAASVVSSAGGGPSDDEGASGPAAKKRRASTGVTKKVVAPRKPREPKPLRAPIEGINPLPQRWALFPLPESFSPDVAFESVPAHDDAPRQVAIWGDGNMSGQLGMGDKTTEADEPVRLATINAKIRNQEDGWEDGPAEICAAGMHTLCVDGKGKVWSWGINDNATLGRVTAGPDSDELESVPMPIEQQDNPTVDSKPVPGGAAFEHPFKGVRCYAGDSISLAQDERGDVKAWGAFRDGQGLLGFNATTLRQWQPTAIGPLQKHSVVQIACGDDHYLALTTTGHVLSAGVGAAGELGRRTFARTPKTNLIPERLTLKDLVLVGAGAFHSFAVDKDGEVYGWGNNTYRQTGVSESDGGAAMKLERPTRVEALSPAHHGGARVVQIAGGAFHSVFLFSNGEVWTVGRADESECGLPEDHAEMAAMRERRKAAQVKQDEWKKRERKEYFVDRDEAKEVEALGADGKPMSLAEIDAEVEQDAATECPLPNNYVATPQRVEFPLEPKTWDATKTQDDYDDEPALLTEQTRIVHVASAGQHSIAVSARGYVYTWGLGIMNQLGNGGERDREPTPRRVLNGVLKGLRAIKAEAGGQHCLVVSVSRDWEDKKKARDEKRRVEAEEKEKARKEKEEEEAKAAAEAAAAPAKEAGGEAEDVEMKDDVPAAAEEKGAEAEKKLEPVAEA